MAFFVTNQVSTVQHAMNGGTKGELFKDQPAGPCARFLAPEPDSGEEGEKSRQRPLSHRPGNLWGQHDVSIEGGPSESNSAPVPRAQGAWERGELFFPAKKEPVSNNRTAEEPGRPEQGQVELLLQADKIISS